MTIDRRTFLTAAAAAAAGLVAILVPRRWGRRGANGTSHVGGLDHGADRRTDSTATAPTRHPANHQRDASRRRSSTPGPTYRTRRATHVPHQRHLDLAQQLLDVLAPHNVVMTSFIVGDWLDANPTWAKKITDAGHELANHTYTHPSFLTLSRDAMLDEIVRCRDVLERLSGSPAEYFRPSGTDDGTAALPEVVLDVAGEAG